MEWRRPIPKDSPCWHGPGRRCKPYFVAIRAGAPAVDHRCPGCRLAHRFWTEPEETRELRLEEDAAAAAHPYHAMERALARRAWWRRAPRLALQLLGRVIGGLVIGSALGGAAYVMARTVGVHP